AQDLEPGFGGFAERRFVQQYATRVFGAAPDAPAQLVELCQSEALGVLDDHHCGFWHVDTNLYDRRGHEEARLARGETLHGTVLLVSFHAAMYEINHGAEALLKRGEAFFGGGQIGTFGDLYQWTDPIDAPALGERATDRADNFVHPAERNRPRVDRSPTRWLFPKFRDVHVAEIGEHKRTRDRRCRHHQHVDRLTLLADRQALIHPDPILFSA